VMTMFVVVPVVWFGVMARNMVGWLGLMVTGASGSVWWNLWGILLSFTLAFAFTLIFVIIFGLDMLWWFRDGRGSMLIYLNSHPWSILGWLTVWCSEWFNTIGLAILLVWHTIINRGCAAEDDTFDFALIRM